MGPVKFCVEGRARASFSAGFGTFRHLYPRGCPINVQNCSFLFCHIMPSAANVYECPANVYECPICMDEIETLASFFVTSCGHMLHMTCFDNLWRHSKKQMLGHVLCPLCKTRICANYYHSTQRNAYDDIMNIITNTTNSVMFRRNDAEVGKCMQILLIMFAFILFLCVVFIILLTRHE